MFFDKKFIFYFVILAYSCNSIKPIYYQHIPEMEQKINKTITELNNSLFSIQDGKKLSRLFVLVNHDEFKTTLTFNFYQNMPLSIRKQIDSSNRFMMISNKKIPVLFGFDDGNNFLRLNGVSHGLIGGYIIQYNNEGQVIVSGPVM